LTVAVYSYQSANANAGQLHQEIADAGLPVEVVLTTATQADVHTTRALTAPEVTTLNGVVAAHVPGSYQSNPGQGEKVKVSVDDTTAGYLTGKLVAGTGVTLTPSAPGVQTLAVAAAFASVLDTETLNLHVTPDGVLWGNVNRQMSLQSDAAGLKLVGDIATPGGSMLYGTDAGGTRGWHAQPAGGGGGELTDGDKVDITVSSGGTIWTIDPGAVTYGKIQNVVDSRLLGRGRDAGVGPPQEVSLGYGLTMSGTSLSSGLTTNGTVVKPSTEAVTGTAFVTLTDPAVAMVAGVYEAWYEATVAVAPSGAANGVKLRLYNDTAAAVVADSERFAISEAGGNFQLAVRATVFLDLAVTGTFRLQAAKVNTNAGTYQVVSDALGKTVIGYKRIR
jgi:hypothetical protein